jgi:hypothetical protein
LGLHLGTAAMRLEAFEGFEGAVPIALGGLLAAEDLGEGVAALGVLGEDGAEGMFSVFEGGHARGDDGGLDGPNPQARPVDERDGR